MLFFLFPFLYDYCQIISEALYHDVVDKNALIARHVLYHYLHY